MKRHYRSIALFATIAALFALGGQGPRATAQQQPAPAEVEPALKLLGKMVGGVWQTTGNFKAELKYEWRIPGKAIRGIGKAAIGTPDEFPMESLYGWDSAVKKVYYLDFHSNDTIYKGWVEAKGGALTGEFSGLIGDSGTYRFTDEMPDDDTIHSSMFARKKTGEWVQIHSMTFKRHRE